MKTANKLIKIADYLESSQSIALLCHQNPDSDTLGSALALRRALVALGKTAFVFCDDLPGAKVAFLPDIQYVNAETDIKKFDLCIAVDCSSPDRVSVVGKYLKRAANTLVIDHHKNTQNFADYVVSVPEAAATAELIFELIEIIGKKHKKDLLDYDTAVLLYSALVGDSGGFSFSNTTSNTLEIAGKLLKFGVPSYEIMYKMFDAQSEKRFCLKAKAMSNTRFYDDGKIGIMYLSAKDFESVGLTINDTEGLINELINVESVSIAFAVSEAYDKNYKVSVRTKEPYDATEITDVFGGGGHERAAGCRVSGFFEDVIDKLIKSSRDIM